MEHAGAGRTPGDPYGVLGVSADASQRDIARAYRRAVQHAHPDARPHDPEAAARFQALTDAYELLRDPVRRADYERNHPAPEPSRKPQPPAHMSAAHRRQRLKIPSSFWGCTLARYGAGRGDPMGRAGAWAVQHLGRC